ncbi:MAG: VCBS repeat-containing protein, partial [Gemmatimonadetes bacterium]|nr:VCBS repeat-containing protein [Gemmatimonadota bacterium]
MRRYAVLSILCACVAAAEAQVRYREVAQEAGIDFQHYNGAQGEYYYVETFGAGAAFFDADGDGWQDLYLINGAHLSGTLPPTPPINHLYRNAGDGTFADLSVASGAGDQGYGMGCAAGDFDNDGDQDLYATNFGPNVLLSNDGGGRFADVTQIAGVGDGRWGTSTGFLDFDNDGDLDLFVANYVHFSLQSNIQCQRGVLRFYCEPSTYAPIGDVLYRNEGRRFVDVTKRMGIRAVGRGLGVAFADSDLDGDTDIYVANDGTPNFLYENQGTRFVEIGLRAGVQYNEDGHAEAGMGVDFGDFDNDGYADLFVTNYSRETNTLYWNDGRGRFADFTAHFGLGAPSYLPLGF